MGWLDTHAGRGAPSIAFHRPMRLLLATVCALMAFKSTVPMSSAQRAAMAAGLDTLGRFVFALAWLRLALRLIGTALAIEPPPPSWQAVLSKAAQGSLDLLMIGLPSLGG